MGWRHSAHVTLAKAGRDHDMSMSSESDIKLNESVQMADRSVLTKYVHFAGDFILAL